VLAVDRNGRAPLCYCVVADRLVFGSTPTRSARFRGQREIDRRAIYAYVYFHMVPGPSHPRGPPPPPARILSVWRNVAWKPAPTGRCATSKREAADAGAEADFLAALRTGVRETAQGGRGRGVLERG